MTVNPQLQNIANQALRVSKIDFGISSGYRTAKEQKALYDAGKSLCDGYKNKSYHQTGNAFDFYCYIDGKANYEDKNMCYVAGIMETVAYMLGVDDVQSGMHFKNFKDTPHIEQRKKLK